MNNLVKNIYHTRLGWLHAKKLVRFNKAMATKAEQLGKKLEVVSDNASRLFSNTEFGKTVGWLFSVEALLREAIRFYAEITTFSDYGRLPTGVLNRPVFNRPRNQRHKYPNNSRLYYGEIDTATFGRLVNWYKLFHPNNKKLYWELSKIKDGRNKIVHQLFRSKNVEADFSKLFPKSIRRKPMKYILNRILADMRIVLDEVKKI